MRRAGPGGGAFICTSPSLPHIGRGTASPSAHPSAQQVPGSGSLVSSASAPTVSNAVQAGLPIRSKRSGAPPGGSAWWGDFIQRQHDHSTLKFRTGLGKLQHDVITASRAVDDEEFWGSKGVEGFRAHLRRQYGSVLAGWRVLDRDKNGRLSFHEFCLACRHMGFHGNLKKLWAEMDVNGNGLVSIMELDPEVGHYVGTFKVALLKKYGDMLTAWQVGLDKNKNGRIDEPEVEESVKSLGLDLDPKKLFGMLRSGTKKFGLTLDQFDPDAWNRLVTGDSEGIALKDKTSHELFDDNDNLDNLNGFPGQTGEMSLPLDVMAKPMKDAARKWRQHLNEQDRAAREKLLAEERKYQLGIQSVEEFKKALLKRCPSLFAAWRKALDLDGNGRLTFSEFTIAVDRLGMHGDIRGLWKKLDTLGDGCIKFSDLDPETDALLSNLRKKLTRRYGNMLKAWVEGIDLLGNGCVNEAQFVRACTEVGYLEDAARLFKLMQPEKGRKFITLEDFDTPAFNALMRGDFRMMTEDADNAKASSRKKLYMTFEERQSTNFSTRLRNAIDVVQRSEFQKACRMEVVEHAIDTPEEFLSLCSRKFGSIVAAWRNCLDADQNGRLTFNEFCKGLRALGYKGDARALWKSYGADARGNVSLGDLDPEADEMVGSFLQLLSQRYNTIDNAWKQCFKKDPGEPIDEPMLLRACNSLGYPHNGHKLFRLLRGAPGRQLLTIWDIDPACTRKRQRGEAATISQQRLPGSPSLTSNSVASSGGGSSGSRALGPRSGSRNASTTFPGVSLVEALRIALRKHYGSTAAAWRGVMDPKLEGSCSFGNFCLVLGQGLFHGNVKGLWQELCGEKRSIVFKDLDPAAADLLDRSREQLLACFGGFKTAWERAFDVKGIGAVDDGHFERICQRYVGMPTRGQAKVLFRLLLSRHGQRSLSLMDFDALLIGVPPEKRPEMWSNPLPGGAMPKLRPRPLVAATPPEPSANPETLPEVEAIPEEEEEAELEPVVSDVAQRNLQSMEQAVSCDEALGATSAEAVPVAALPVPLAEPSEETSPERRAEETTEIVQRVSPEGHEVEEVEDSRDYVAEQTNIMQKEEEGDEHHDLAKVVAEEVATEVRDAAVVAPEADLREGQVHELSQSP